MRRSTPIASGVGGSFTYEALDMAEEQIIELMKEVEDLKNKNNSIND